MPLKYKKVKRKSHTPYFSKYVNWEQIVKTGQGELVDRVKDKLAREESEEEKERDIKLWEEVLEEEDNDTDIQTSLYVIKTPDRKSKNARHYSMNYRTLTELKTTFRVTSKILYDLDYQLQNKIMVACMYSSATKSKKLDNGYGSLLTTLTKLSEHFGITTTSVHNLIKKLVDDKIISVANYRTQFVSTNSKGEQIVNFLSPLDYGCTSTKERPKEIMFLKDFSYEKYGQKKRYGEEDFCVNINCSSDFYFNINYEVIKKWKKEIGIPAIMLYFYMWNILNKSNDDCVIKTGYINIVWLATKIRMDKKYAMRYIKELAKYKFLQRNGDTFTIFNPNKFTE